MRVAVIGTGHVGLVVAACLAHVGHAVVGMDDDVEKIAKIARGETPFFEPTLGEVMEAARAAGRLAFTADLRAAIHEKEVVLLSLGTKLLSTGGLDFSAVEGVARRIGGARPRDLLVVETGRVPAQGAARIERTLAMYGVPGGSAIEVAAGPVFFREGSAVEDFLHPDRVVVGVRSPRGEARLRELYAPLLGRRFPCPVHATCPSKGAVPFLATDVSTAELIRYATTVFLATKISFINAVADLCERLGADVQQVTEGVGLDRRIGREALGAGLGFGGPCLPGDVLAFLHIADEVGVDLGLVREVEQVNRRRIKVAVEKLRRALRTLQGKRVGLLGLAFKPETDDLRGSPALALVPRLVGEGADVVGYDPKAGAAAGLLLPTMAVVNDPYAVAEQADALVLATEWPEFLSLEWGRLKRVMRRPVVLDGRNALDREKLQAEGFEYLGMGR